MELILTHEQADFDAMASMLAASHLNDSLIPVLPNRLNRNVRKFMNLYGAELPFVDTRDLPSEKVESVTLVDTQAMVTLKGITRHTQIAVVDHHLLRPDIPTDWKVTIEKTGATTTILVDALREQNGSLNMIEATLLLLGIYEDTGSLTYASTTPRDVKAAAYLLEHGANLKIAAEFLNPSLSEEQLKLSDRLLANTQNLTIHGKHILVATAEAPEMTEEISSVAHKLRDLLDPDALFIFVRTVEGIRLVARSTSDQINVAKVAAEFGGGGHDRAAAALINTPEAKVREPDALEENRARLIALLPTFIKPSLTVGKIMSRKPTLISGDTSVEEAAYLMQRYGYEGFPVIEGGRVVGLLTRRAVDRALSHRLKSTAGSLMEAGEYFLMPSSTLDELQTLMATTGWGQIPVIDPQSRQVIGIVTRTDLLNSLPKGEIPIPGQVNYAARLERALPPLRLALLKLVSNQAFEERMAIYIVGGFVRDLVLERPSTDFDIVVEGDAIHLARKLSAKFGGKVTSHKRFGTAKWLITGIKSQLMHLLSSEKGNGDELPESLDLVSARTEFYDHPSALPTVERSSIKLDLHRRDFTINTLALRLDGSHFGKIFDFWGGYSDLQQKKIRVLHALSFVDDATRMLRAVRFATRFNFEIEPQTLSLIEGSLPLLAEISGARLIHEFELIFNENKAPEMIRQLGSLGILAAIHPALPWDDQTINRLTRGLTALSQADMTVTPEEKLQTLWCLWLQDLNPEALQAVGRRLHLSTKLLGWIEQTRALWQLLPTLQGQRPSQITQKLEGFHAIPIRSVFATCENPDLRQILQIYQDEYRHVRPFTTGKDLQALGLPPSPRYAAILSALKQAWLDGQVKSEVEEKVLLQKLLEKE